LNGEDFVARAVSEIRSFADSIKTARRLRAPAVRRGHGSTATGSAAAQIQKHTAE